MTTNHQHGPSAGLPVAVAGVIVGRRPLTPDRADLGAVNTRMFVSIALVEFLALLSSVAAFVVEAGVLYLIGGAAALVGLALIAPTDARLRADDQALQRQGVSTSVRAQAYGADDAAGA